MNADCVEEISLLLRAGWRVIALESFEEERALVALERAARSAKRVLRTWSVAAGEGIRPWSAARESPKAERSARLRTRPEARSGPSGCRRSTLARTS